MITRGLLIHTAILAVAGGLALKTWTTDETKAPKHGETDLWPGSPDQVQEVRYEAKQGLLTLEPHHDSTGAYYVGTVKKNPSAEPEKKLDEHGNPVASTPPPANPSEPKTSRFIATKDGDDLVASLAPLRALRVLGKVTDAQKLDFGFDKEEGRLTIKLGGKSNTLVFGGTTPGGSDYYAKDLGSGNAYVVLGSIVRDLTNADQRLVERRLHGFEDTAAKRVKITAGSATRELVRSADKKGAWTKPGAPNDKDETATNWMSKVDRLRTTSYEGDTLHPPPAAADLVFKIEYFDERKPIGVTEIWHHPGADGKTDYVVKTELTRWYATVIRSAAEQVEQDLKSVVTP
ncbi:MAG TPA: DUF4340 domain-containing protein [Polyangiaceae bacterium]|nr:DUF4340 domain-containing protein [Polyangiaceae bacterium]